MLFQEENGFTRAALLKAGAGEDEGALTAIPEAFLRNNDVLF